MKYSKEQTQALLQKIENSLKDYLLKNNIRFSSLNPGFISKKGNYFNLNQNQRCLGFFYMGLFVHSEKEITKRVNISEKTDWFI